MPTQIERTKWRQGPFGCYYCTADDPSYNTFCLEVWPIYALKPRQWSWRVIRLEPPRLRNPIPHLLIVKNGKCASPKRAKQSCIESLRRYLTKGETECEPSN